MPDRNYVIDQAAQAAYEVVRVYRRHMQQMGRFPSSHWEELDDDEKATLHLRAEKAIDGEPPLKPEDYLFVNTALSMASALGIDTSIPEARY